MGKGKKRNHRRGPTADSGLTSGLGEKVPVAEKPADWSEQRPVWRFALMDLDHEEWGWKRLSAKSLADVREALATLEGNTWKEILAMRAGKGPRNGPIDLDKLVQKNSRVGAAIRDKAAVQLAGSLMKLRYQKRGRIWGIMEGEVCSLLWVDENHTVWSD